MTDWQKIVFRLRAAAPSAAFYLQAEIHAKSSHETNDWRNNVHASQDVVWTAENGARRDGISRIDDRGSSDECPDCRNFLATPAGPKS
jgi:hypothetical protein